MIRRRSSRTFTPYGTNPRPESYRLSVLQTVTTPSYKLMARLALYLTAPNFASPTTLPPSLGTLGSRGWPPLTRHCISPPYTRLRTPTVYGKPHSPPLPAIPPLLTPRPLSQRPPPSWMARCWVIGLTDHPHQISRRRGAAHRRRVYWVAGGADAPVRCHLHCAI